MEKFRIPQLLRSAIPLVILYVILLSLMPKAGNFSYDYRKGYPWMYEDLIARFDFPVLKTSAQLEEDLAALGQEKELWYRRDPSVSRDRSFACKGICDCLPEGGVVCVEGAQVQRIPRNDLMSLSDARSQLMDRLRAQDAQAADSLYEQLSLKILPDLLYDEARTEAVFRSARENLATTLGVVYAGETIVSKEEVITAEIQNKIDSYRQEYDRHYGYDGNPLLLWLGNGILALVIVALLLFALVCTTPGIFAKHNQYLFLLTVFLLTVLVTFPVEAAHPLWLYSVPYSLFALFMLAFFPKRTVLPLYLISLFPLLLVHSGVELFLIQAAAGVFNLFVFTRFSKGWRQFACAFFTFLVMALVFTGFRLIASSVEYDYSILFRLLAGAFLAVAGYPLIFLFERIFFLVSDARLDELCDTKASLLQTLSMRAPGTYQHCLHVANMAEKAARDIGANVSLARAGALYHDVGKLHNPLCFVENQLGGEDYHAHLSCQDSARAIIRHVSDGIELARHHRLPEVLIRFIRTHHGTSCAAFFYGKYLKEGGDESQRPLFCYPGPTPQSAEETLVMICDSVEAASRTLKDYSDESITRLVEGIVAGKADEGQLSASELSLGQLETVKRSLVDYLRQAHHARIEYPKVKN